jgi:CRP-like cAMP-binding protein
MNEETAIGEALEQLGIGEGFRDTLLGMLQHTQLLRDFSAEEIRALGEYCGAYRVAAGKQIFGEGERSNFMCILVKGKADIIKDGKKVASVGAGKTMGEMSLIDGYPHSASALTTEDTEVVLITRFNFQRLMQQDPQLAMRLLWKIGRLMSLRLRRTTGVLIDYLD